LGIREVSINVVVAATHKHRHTGAFNNKSVQSKVELEAVGLCLVSVLLPLIVMAVALLSVEVVVVVAAVVVAVVVSMARVRSTMKSKLPLQHTNTRQPLLRASKRRFEAINHVNHTTLHRTVLVLVLVLLRARG